MNWLKRLFKKEETPEKVEKEAKVENQLLLAPQPSPGDMELNLGMSLSTHVDADMNVHVYISSVVVTSANQQARVMLEMIDDKTLSLMICSLCTAAAIYSKQESGKKQFLKAEIPNGPTTPTDPGTLLN